MPTKQPNLIERLLFGPDVNRGVERKGLFQYDGIQQYAWSNPTIPQNAYGFYTGRINYAVETGDLVDNSAVMACMNWLMRNVPKATPRVVLPTEDGLEPVPNHAFTRKLKRPNPVYSGTQLLRGTVASYYWDGNAYWRKVRNAQGQVLEYWWEPHWTCRPVRTNANEFVSNYQLWRNRQWVDVPREDIVHFRWGFSTYDEKLGMAPLASALRDVFTDNEAARYAATMFRNLGVVGGIVSSDSDDMPIDNPERLKAELEALTTGDERGKWLVEDVPLRFAFPQTDPGKLNTRENRKVTEERVSALLGVPAQVAGLGAGLDRNILGSPEEALRWAYDNNVIPTLAGWAEELDIQTLNDFTSVEDETVEFDTSAVSALRGDVEKREASTANLWSVGLITRAQGKIRLGYKPADDGSDDVYRLSPLLEVELLKEQGQITPDAETAVTGGKSLIDHETGLVKALTNGHKVEKA